MKDQTIHKSVTAFITSFVALLAAMGVVVPEWITTQGIENVSWIVTALWSLAGGLIVGGATWAVRNKPRGTHEGPFGG